MIEAFIRSKIEAFKTVFHKRDDHVSPKNRLVHSFIFERDDHHIVSPDNKLIHADMGNPKEPPAK